MMKRTFSRRAMRRETYQEAVAALKTRHPWLAHQLVEPAPGHLAALEEFLVRCKQLMNSGDVKCPPLFCATALRDKLSLRVEFVDGSDWKERALLDLVLIARHTSERQCPVCGAPVFENVAREDLGTRCKRHQFTTGWFSGELRRKPNSAVGRDQPSSQIAGQPSRGPAHNTNTATTAPEHPQQNPSNTPPPEKRDSQKTAPEISFLDAAALDIFVDRHRPKGDDKLRRAQLIADRIRAAGNDRRSLGVLPDSGIALIEEFSRMFPNFAELADVLRDHFALTAMGDGRISWSPLLLVGPAGIGKTEATRWLADRLHLPFRVFDMASTQSNSPLAGSEAFWSNSEPGILFELLAYQPKANPVVVLDELDKTGQNRAYDPLAALYTLLEPRSAERFVDLSIRDFGIDASHVNWIATANSVETIPAPLLSRMTVLQIQPPTTEQVALIAQSIYARMLTEASWGRSFSPQLEESVLNALRELPPRGLRLALRRALGRAAQDRRDRLQVSDLPAIVRSSRRPIGFTD